MTSSNPSNESTTQRVNALLGPITKKHTDAWGDNPFTSTFFTNLVDAYQTAIEKDRIREYAIRHVRGKDPDSKDPTDVLLVFVRPTRKDDMAVISIVFKNKQETI